MPDQTRNVAGIIVHEHMSVVKRSDDRIVGFVESERQGVLRSGAHVVEGKVHTELVGTAPQNEADSLIVARIAYMLLATVVGCTRAADEELPPFVTQLIAELEASPKTDPPGAIWRYSYKGDVVFYVPASCCDIPSTLFATDGSIVCGPDGGISGRGDGRCPDFFAVRTDEKRVWSDKR